MKTLTPPCRSSSAIDIRPSWKALHGWLHERACRQRGLTLIEGALASSPGQNDDEAHVDVDGLRMSADVLIGADGYKSAVRAVIDPSRPDATYAGYLLWRGLVEERALPPGTALPNHRVAVHYVGRYRLVAYAVPGPDGSTARGERSISWAWYDPARNDWLDEIGAVRDGRVLRGVGSDAVSPEMADELRARAITTWARALGRHRRRQHRAWPDVRYAIAEYLPDRLARGRLAMVGDAAHVVSPMTGAGFIIGLEDVLSLAGRLAEGSDGREGPGRPHWRPVAESLSAFERDRLADGRALAEASMRWSRDYLGLPPAA